MGPAHKTRWVKTKVELQLTMAAVLACHIVSPMEEVHTWGLYTKSDK